MTAPAPQPRLPLRIRFADLGGMVAEMTGDVLTLDPSCDRDEQLATIAAAADYLRTGVLPERWRPKRHLRAVR